MGLGASPEVIEETKSQAAHGNQTPFLGRLAHGLVTIPTSEPFLSHTFLFRALAKYRRTTIPPTFLGNNC